MIIIWNTRLRPYPLVIYCDKESYELIRAIRPEFLKDKTQYIICEFDDFCFVGEKIGGGGRVGSRVGGGRKIKSGGKTFREYRKIIQENRRQKPYHSDPRNTASYYLFCMSRYIMLKCTIDQNPFQSTHFAWINFCIERMGWQNVARLEEALNVGRDRFSTCYIDYIPRELVNNPIEYWKWGRCSMCSGFFTGNAEYMYKVCDLIENKFLEYLGAGYGHADEQLYSPVYFEHPELFEHYYGDYQQMITNYKWIYDSPHTPIYNFIRNSYYAGEYKKCYEACQVVFKSLCMKKCEINDEGLLRDLYFCYMQCKRIVGDF